MTSIFQFGTEIEYGNCGCGVRTHASSVDNETVFICEDCREYFKGGFNVVVATEPLRACMVCGTKTTSETCPDAFCGANTRKI
jgi:hypothetical protein